MKLSSKARYAVTAMLDLALHHTDEDSAARATSLADISQRQGISLSYLEQLFVKLRRRGLVSSLRGPGGGYYLNQPIEDIYITDIIDAVEEKIEAMSCKGQADCRDGKICLTHGLWSDLSQHIHSFLSGVSLATLVEKQHDSHAHGADEQVLSIASLA